MTNVLLSHPNYAGNIIIVLANLPDFLRTPILKKRMLEFFSMSEEEKDEIITNALDAGPTIPFPNFAKLFKTWLEVLSTISEQQRTLIFSAYVHKIIEYPQKIINYNIDGILEIFRSLDSSQKGIISSSIRSIVSQLTQDQARRLMLLVPENAKKDLGI